ncbi:putative Myb/SANT-like domain-containing protein [Medicago truncatula]|uniref:Putative Myb/SANT-like domain-containing protein n=1 Tax=Medicago truncatula TaxID=3880 RepID=A0A396JQC8_MEDTR|nr:putative Myb/SANT-like domain-containing protein [Medicago truncatula]
MDQVMQGNEIGDDSSINLDNSRANWTPSQDQYFLELLLSHVHKGNKTGKVFTRLAWADMTEQFNSKFGFKYDVDVLKNRYKRFKKQYYEIKAMASQNGFQWDGRLNTITANDKTWEEYIKAHPDAQVFRKKLFPCYNDLCIIYGHTVADGRYSLSCFDEGFEYEENASKELDDHTSTSKGVDDQTPPTPSQSKIDWSPMMDRVFVELMLDQVRKGNKAGRTFTRQAWGDMAESFNNRFGCHYGKVVLKNRFNVLSRHYSSINELLGKEGFSWDKAQHKVVANDQVWQKCIRVNHKFRLYRIKSMPFYSGMCIVCRDEAPADCKSILERKSYGNKNSTPDPNGSLHIGSENNFIGDTQPLPYASLHTGDGSNFTKEPLPDTAFHVGGENSFIRDTITQPLPNATLDIGGENNFTRDTITEPLQNATLHIGGENNFTFIGGENNFIGGAQPPANADNEGGGKNSTRDEGSERIFTRKTQPQNADKEPLLLSAGKNISRQKKRHQTKAPATLNEPKKARNYNEGMSVALKHMAVAVTSLTNKTKKEDNFSVGNVMKVLQAIPDLDDDLILDACDFLEDEKRARLFLALPANLRKKWLLRKLRS